ncbi:UNVERIFIED_CONTAM: Helicase SEN1 [Sesamum radiatum]|uniref:Helicase SEN1 n=1 Tax=Sesamum radiatum TaxID=300843 RepID=A0AAW2PDX8_SESRA
MGLSSSWATTYGGNHAGTDAAGRELKADLKEEVITHGGLMVSPGAHHQLDSCSTDLVIEKMSSDNNVGTQISQSSIQSEPSAKEIIHLQLNCIQKCLPEMNSASNVQQSLKKPPKTSDETMKELVCDTDDNAWKFSFFKPPRRHQTLITKPSTSGPKRQVIQLTSPVVNRPGSMRLGAGVQKRFQPPRLDDCFWNGKDNQNVGKLKEVPVCFESPDGYVEIFRPLVLEEFKAQLQSSYQEMASAEEMSCGSLSVLSVERIDDFHVVRFVHDEDESTGSKSLSENDLVLLTKQPLRNLIVTLTLLERRQKIMVERREKDNKRRLNILAIRLYLQGCSRLNRARKFLTERSKCQLRAISLAIVPFDLKKDFELTLVQGPPSNAAVDELVARISSEGLYGCDGHRYKPYLVRVGNAKTVHPNSLPFFIDTLVENRLGEEKRNTRDEKKSSTSADSLTTLRTNLEKLVDRIRYYESKRASLQEGNSDCKNLVKEIVEMPRVLRHKYRTAILKEAEIVVTTLSGCGGDLYGVCSESTSGHKFISSSENTLFDAVVIDEAAQRAGHPVIMLKEQYRMHPEICRFPSLHFYEGKLLNGDQMSDKAASFHGTGCLGPYVFFDIIDGQELRGKNAASLSLYNEAEAEAAVEVLRFFRTRYLSCISVILFSMTCVIKTVIFDSYPKEFSGGRIGIITPYKRQLSLLHSRFSSAFGPSITAEMEFNTVDGFQGREVDILLLSTVRAAGCSDTARVSSSNLGFVADVRRMNVALTRAKLSLWIFGHARTLQTNQSWAALLEDAQQRNLIVSGKKPYSSIYKFGLENRPSGNSSKIQLEEVERIKPPSECVNTQKKVVKHIPKGKEDALVLPESIHTGCKVKIGKDQVTTDKSWACRSNDKQINVKKAGVGKGNDIHNIREHSAGKVKSGSQKHQRLVADEMCSKTFKHDKLQQAKAGASL